MPNSGEITSVFVYGTLKRGELREGMWPCAPLSVVEATIRGELYDLGPYPALLPAADDSPGDTISGEVWSFTADDMPEVLRVLDEIECYDQPGEPSLYLRAETSYRAADGQSGTAQVYYFADRESLVTQARRVAPGNDGICRWNAPGGAAEQRR